VAANALDKVAKLLFKLSEQQLTAFIALREMPGQSKGYKGSYPGYGPLHGDKCPTCFENLDEASHIKPSHTNADRHRMKVEHTFACAVTAEREVFLPTFQRKKIGCRCIYTSVSGSFYDSAQAAAKAERTQVPRQRQRAKRGVLCRHNEGVSL
jgi:hypothetical protein